jgi:SAM-dependent methyltransferase
LANYTKAEREQIAKFNNFYQLSTHDVLRRIEKYTCGCCYGGSSWTTEKQASFMGQKLGLSPRSSLIDIGAGAGWPGLYLSSISGCSLTLVDLPETGLKLAADRSIQDKISERVTTIIADAAELPFEDQSFDALSHSDLLCCLFSKEKVLIECRRIIREQGKMVFSVIYITPGLDKIDYERAVLNSPDFIQTDGEYETMLRECGWHIDEQIDLSKEYQETCRLQIEADDLHQQELIKLLGEKQALERMTNWKSKLEVIKEGLVKRDLFVCSPNKL